jgi:sugar/nucleoside kinase (ribokinase family)
MNKVIGLGNALMDIMIPLENDDILKNIGFPRGSMQLVDAKKSNHILKLTAHLKSSLASGGSAANTIHGIANLGLETAFIGKVGKDDYGMLFEEDLKKSGITPTLFYSPTETGRALAMVSPDSERTFGTYLGAAVEMNPDDITPKTFTDYELLHIEGYLVFNEALIEKAVKTAKELGLKVSLDLASFNVVEAKVDFLHRIAEQYVDIIFANEEEAQAFTSEKKPEIALKKMAESVNLCIVKTGKKGSLIMQDNLITQVGIVDVKPIDTTGAGDYYAAGFLYGHLVGLSNEKSGNIGALLAGKVIEQMGCVIPKNIWKEILSEIEKIKSL